MNSATTHHVIGEKTPRPREVKRHRTVGAARVQVEGTRDTTPRAPSISASYRNAK